MFQTIKAGVLIIGTGAAGTAAASELRARGYAGRLTLVNGEAESPYNRTAVNKGLLGGQMSLTQVALRLPDDEDVTTWHGRRVTRLDTEARCAHLDTGERLEYDAVLVATGAEPRPLDVSHTQVAANRVHQLRTAADAATLRSALDEAAARRGDRTVRVGVVGAGLLGAETADTLAAEGAAVTLVDPDPAPLDRLLGATVAGWVRAQQRGVLTPAFATSVAGVHLLGDAVLMRLCDGTHAVVDVILVASGVTPATACLSPLFPVARDGVPTDEHLRVLGVAGLYAAGDVARPRRGGVTVRGEHWGQALAQGRHVARVMLHDLGLSEDPGPLDAPESFATRLHGKAITVLGRPGPEGREVVLAGSREDDAVTLALVDRDGRLVGGVALGSPRTLNKLRPLVASRALLADARTALDELVPTAG
ncbi:NAD(P)/FAD-dependent oxidoreductase [Nocardioides sp.]|uniref:NAD(P)/FAD-dependent oxidoreductase n=1 Tax=Nocardioides sp. TaxID=35761 RepID=UPI00356162B0